MVDVLLLSRLLLRLLEGGLEWAVVACHERVVFA